MENKKPEPDNIFETDSLMDAFKFLIKPMPVMVLLAIHLKEPLKTAEGSTRRITAGDLLFIEDGEIKDFVDQPTHRIKECRGTATSHFEITVVDIITGKEEIIKL